MKHNIKKADIGKGLVNGMAAGVTAGAAAALVREVLNAIEDAKAEKKLVSAMVGMLGIRPRVHLLAPHSVVRSEGKAVRVIDNRRI